MDYVPWILVNAISFGTAFPASLSDATVCLASWLLFLSAGSGVQLKDNGLQCPKRDSNTLLFRSG